MRGLSPTSYKLLAIAETLKGITFQGANNCVKPPGGRLLEDKISSASLPLESFLNNSFSGLKADNHQEGMSDKNQLCNSGTSAYASALFDAEKEVKEIPYGMYLRRSSTTKTSRWYFLSIKNCPPRQHNSILRAAEKRMQDHQNHLARLGELIWIISPFYRKRSFSLALHWTLRKIKQTSIERLQTWPRRHVQNLGSSFSWVFPVLFFLRRKRWDSGRRWDTLDISKGSVGDLLLQMDRVAELTIPTATWDMGWSRSRQFGPLWDWHSSQCCCERRTIFYGLGAQQPSTERDE